MSLDIPQAPQRFHVFPPVPPLLVNIYPQLHMSSAVPRVPNCSTFLHLFYLCCSTGPNLSAYLQLFHVSPTVPHFSCSTWPQMFYWCQAFLHEPADPPGFQNFHTNDNNFLRLIHCNFMWPLSTLLKPNQILLLDIARLVHLIISCWTWSSAVPRGPWYFHLVLSCSA
jgi:hypothetical protein